MSNKKWECEIIAPPELHKPIQELFDAISWKLKHAESSSAQIATDINVGCTIYRQSAIDALDVGKELLSCALNNMDIVGNDREKFEWGLGLIESYIEGIKDIPPAQPTYTDEEIQRMQDLESAEIEKAYQLGYEEGKKYAQPTQTNADSTQTNALDCVSRQEAIDAIHNCYCGGEDSCGEPWIYEDDAIKAIEQLPSAQRKKGKWIILPPIFEEICQCSNCKMKFKDALQWTNDCPNCGADMRGDEK